MTFWTKDRPTTPGSYWVRTSEGEEAGYRILYRNSDGDIMEASPVNWAGYWWPIPISVPEFRTDDGR